MSIFKSALETVIGFLPAGEPDPLLNSKVEVGKPMTRRDGPLKVTGGAKFTAEYQLEGLTFAALVNSTIPKGKITTLDTAAAERSPGVLLVMTYKNAPRMKAPPKMGEDPNSGAISALPVMQDAKIHWNGEPVAVVVAESQEQADATARLVKVTYAADAALLSFEKAKTLAKPPKDIMGEKAEVKTGGDAEAALAASAVKVDQIYHTPRHYNAAIEPHAVTAHWTADDAVSVYDASQVINAEQYTLAKMFGLKQENIRVMAPFVGGGFGSKLQWSYQPLAVAAAKLVKRPVRLNLSREDVFRLTGGRTVTEQRVALGAKPDNTLAALIHTGTTAIVTHNNCPEQFCFPARYLYAADNILSTQKTVALDMVANCFMRAPGESVGTFALESALDELALLLKVDPVELRKNIEPTKDPTKGTPHSSRHLVDAYKAGAEKFGWADRNKTPGGQRDGEWLIGQGCATAYYPYYRMPGGTAKIILKADCTAVVSAAAHEMGMGTSTAQAQSAAERLGLPVENVSFEYGDTALPKSTIAGGSSQSAGLIAAVAAAYDLLVADLIKLAGKDSPLAGAKPAAVVSKNGGLYLAASPEKGESYEAILKRAGKTELAAEAAAPMPAEMMKFSMHSYGAQFCEVGVNEVTGEIRVRRWVGSFDCGRILNAKTAASQFRGGIIMGIGLALTEETLFDERAGRIANATLAEYHVPVHADVPHIDVLWTDIPDPQAPMGVRGIGEIGITGCGAAIANAVHNATGKRIRSLPITLDKVLMTRAG